MSLDTARRVLKIEAQAIQDVLARLDTSFEKAVDLLFACKGRVVVTGMGKSGLIGRKIAATLSSTGTLPSSCTQPKLCTGIWACSPEEMLSWPSPMVAKPKRSCGSSKL